MDVICGHGRLGSRIAALLHARGRKPLLARLDASAGLLLQEQQLLEQQLPERQLPERQLPERQLPELQLPERQWPDGRHGQHIECLLLCLAPRHPEQGSGWLGLLDGLLQQCQAGQWRIDRVLLVSSTAVYDGLRCGWVRADTPVLALSARSAGLIEAEQRVRAMTADTHILRLAGLTGPGYERYDPLVLSQTQPRHAVDVRAAATLIADLTLLPPGPPRTELVSNGYVYWRGQRLPADPDQAVLQPLADAHRLLLPSLLARVDSACLG